MKKIISIINIIKIITFVVMMYQIYGQNIPSIKSIDHDYKQINNPTNNPVYPGPCPIPTLSQTNYSKQNSYPESILSVNEKLFYKPKVEKDILRLIPFINNIM